MSETKPITSFEVTTNRLEAFSDGVFAIAITLLIIEIKVPSHDELKSQSLMTYILQLWPKYFAYILSFVMIGIYWANHHYLFRLFRRTDHVFNLLNVFFLMTISFLPFPTDVLGDYIMNAEQEKHAVTFYALAIWMPAFAWLLIWLYAKYRRIIDPRLTPRFVKVLTMQYGLSNVLYGSAFLVSLMSPIGSIIICVGLTLLYLLPPKKPEYQ
jgi:TMEM175 potassium channel family protein